MEISIESLGLEFFMLCTISNVIFTLLILYAFSFRICFRLIAGGVLFARRFICDICFLMLMWVSLSLLASVVDLDSTINLSTFIILFVANQTLMSAFSFVSFVLLNSEQDGIRSVPIAIVRNGDHHAPLLSRRFVFVCLGVWIDDESLAGPNHLYYRECVAKIKKTPVYNENDDVWYMGEMLIRQTFIINRCDSSLWILTTHFIPTQNTVTIYSHMGKPFDNYVLDNNVVTTVKSLKKSHNVRSAV